MKDTISKIARGLGASDLEVNALLGIAYAETKFDCSASGDGGYSNGMFQAERTPGVSVENQIANALKRIRIQLEYIKPLFDLPNYVDTSAESTIRYLRAGWQCAEVFLRNWTRSVVNRVATAEALGVDVASRRGMVSGDPNRPVDIRDLLTYAEMGGIKVNALKMGQTQLETYMSDLNWNPLSTVKIAGGGSVALIIGIVAAYFIWKQF